ncbi:MAG TPA: DegT/DnrJ/EryC1/StrS family aminotransferase [Candidatus Binatia bacterium]|nr:DegT/DnrJ/EryC1/StrS family aminotransferase [Candidatus Binatia bacterium]
MKRAPLASPPPTSVQEDDLPAIVGGTPVRPRQARLIFGAPLIGEREIASVVQCLRSNWIGLGPRVEQFEQAFARYKGAPHAAAVSSGTAAIHLALLALGVGPGDEVIAPAMTFCSSIHSIVHTGATPVLVDCDRKTFNIDPALIEKNLTPQTRAILAVHMCGRCCDMDPILDIARRRGLRVVEDCAHAIEATHRGRPAGLMGDAGCFSFYPTKNVGTCDGGMVITRDRALHQRVKVLSLHGMTADAWSRFVGGPSGYEVVAAGFKYNMTDVAAALALPQLEKVECHWKKREQIWHFYDERLSGLPLQLPAATDAASRHAFHLYTPLLSLEEIGVTRDKVIAALDAENIGVGVHYVPPHQQPYYRQRFGFADSDFPNATFIGQRTISLPLSPAMLERDVEDVAAALKRIFRYYRPSA